MGSVVTHIAIIRDNVTDTAIIHDTRLGLLRSFFSSVTDTTDSSTDTTDSSTDIAIIGE